MRKTLLLCCLMILLMPTVAYGYGIGTSTMRQDYPGADDLRRFEIAENMDTLLHPTAGFVATVRDHSQMSTDTAYIISAMDNSTIDAVVGDQLQLTNLSAPGSGDQIIKYDIQYRFTPEGGDREDYNLTATIVRSWGQVEDIIRNINLTDPGELEIYLAVADNTPCLPGAENWSINGNVRVLNTSNPNYPDGIFWYFSGLTVIVEDSPGIDLQVLTQDANYSESPGVPVNVCVEFDLSRLDNQPVPVDAVITWTGAATGSKSVTIYSTEARNQAVYNAGPGNENAIMERIVEDSVLRVNFVGYAGNTYYVTGDIMPRTANDVDLSNNTATAKITIYPRTAAGGVPDIPDMDIDEEIIVNITG